MSKSMLFQVREDMIQPGIYRLHPLTDKVAMKPGKYTLTLRRYDVGDTVVRGARELVALGVSVGDKCEILGAASMRTPDNPKLKFYHDRTAQPFELEPGDCLDVECALAQTAGKEPAAIRELASGCVARRAEQSEREAGKRADRGKRNQANPLA